MTIGARVALAGALILAACGCFNYRGPRGVEESLEHTLGVELHPEEGIKLGPISTRFVASFVGHDEDDFLSDLSRVGIAVFEVGASNGQTPRPIQASDLGFRGWSTMLDMHDDGDQVLLLVKPRKGSIREMMLVSVDGDEVVVARLTGNLDHLIAKAMDGAEHGGAKGARAAVGQ
jgi:hypothetical protein